MLYSCNTQYTYEKGYLFPKFGLIFFFGGETLKILKPKLRIFPYMVRLKPSLKSLNSYKKNE